MRRVGKFEDIDDYMKEPLPCTSEYSYRNKMTFTVGTDQQWLVDGNKEKLKAQPIIGEIWLCVVVDTNLAFKLVS